MGNELTRVSRRAVEQTGLMLLRGGRVRKRREAAAGGVVHVLAGVERLNQSKRLEVASAHRIS